MACDNYGDNCLKLFTFLINFLSLVSLLFDSQFVNCDWLNHNQGRQFDCVDHRQLFANTVTRSHAAGGHARLRDDRGGKNFTVICKLWIYELDLLIQIIISSIAILLSFLGCCATIREHVYSLYVFAAISVLIALAQLTIAVFLLNYSATVIT